MKPEITAAWLKQHAVAERAGQHKDCGVIHSSGHVDCLTCGGWAGSNKAIATAIGVPVHAFSNWLARKPVRSDHADRIRASFARVGE